VAFYLVLLVTLLNHISFKGSKILISLFAIDLGATPMTIGVLFAMYSVFPVFLSVYAGKVSDRLGFRWPMVFGSVGLLCGLLLPYAVPSLTALFVSATLIGMCYIFYIVSVQHLIGSMGEGIARTRNYSIFSVCVGLTALVGPTTAGFAIDGIGHRSTYLLLAAFPVVPIIVLMFLKSYLPQPRRHDEPRTGQRVMDLLGNVPLRRVLITAGILETGNELVNFLLPIYGHSIGLTASEIGLVIGGFGSALLLIRALMPALVRRWSEEQVLGGSMLLAALTCLAFPLVESFALLLCVAFVMGLGLGCGAPLSLVLSYNRAPSGRSGEAMGLRQTVNKGTEVLVPIVFGTLSTAVGMLPVFWLDAVMLGIGGWLMRRDGGLAGKPAPEKTRAA
jgi:MFS family permease